MKSPRQHTANITLQIHLGTDDAGLPVLSLIPGPAQINYVDHAVRSINNLALAELTAIADAMPDADLRQFVYDVAEHYYQGHRELEEHAADLLVETRDRRKALDEVRT